MTLHPIGQLWNDDQLTVFYAEIVPIEGNRYRARYKAMAFNFNDDSITNELLPPILRDVTHRGAEPWQLAQDMKPRLEAHLADLERRRALRHAWAAQIARHWRKLTGGK